MTATAVSTDPARAATLFQALADEKRLRILSMLSGGEHCVCELAEALDIGQSLLSFHLKSLRDVGLVTDRRDGRWVYYSVVPEALTRATSALTDLSTDVSGRPRERAPGRPRERAPMLTGRRSFATNRKDDKS